MATNKNSPSNVDATVSKLSSAKTNLDSLSDTKNTVKRTTAKKTPSTKKVSTKSKSETVEESEKIHPSTAAASEKSRIIKKYPNRRLYDTLHSTYVTLFDIKGLVMSNINFHVLDAKTGEDITRNILMQIILEEEAAGQPIFSKQSLLQMIRFYGNSLQGMMAPFLEQNMNQFLELQNQYLAHCQKIGGLVSPETWASFVTKQHSIDYTQPMNYLFEAGSKILEQIQSQSKGVMNSFPFKKSN